MNIAYTYCHNHYNHLYLFYYLFIIYYYTTAKYTTTIITTIHILTTFPLYHYTYRANAGSSWLCQGHHYLCRGPQEEAAGIHPGWNHRYGWYWQDCGC